MKKLSLTFLTIFLFSSAKASINPSIHSLCKDVKDYQGCVELNSVQKISYYKFPNPKISDFTYCKKSQSFEDDYTEKNTGRKTLKCYTGENIRNNNFNLAPIDSERIHLAMFLEKYMSKNNEQLGWLLIQSAINCKSKIIEEKVIASNNKPRPNWNGSFEPRLDFIGIDKTPREFEPVLKSCPVKSGYQVVDIKKGLEVNLMAAVKKKDVYVLPASLNVGRRSFGKPFQIHLNCKEKRYRSFQNGTYGNSVNVTSNDAIFWRTCGSKK